LDRDCPLQFPGLNGKPAEKLELTPENNDLLHQFAFKNVSTDGVSTVGLRFEGKGGLAYQIVGSYYLPWDEKAAGEPLSIDVAYDRTRLAQDDIAIRQSEKIYLQTMAGLARPRLSA
jgi:hypothetical protein